MINHWFTADHHFNHKNIIKHCNRPFPRVEDMNEVLILQWNLDVKDKDVVYHLGDFGWGQCDDIFKELRGNKVLISGNHDDNRVKRLGWGWVKDVHMYRYQDIRIWLSHYAHRAWHKSHRGYWHLYGHSHGELPSYGKSFDCGVDMHDYCLWHLDEVVDRMKELPGRKT